MSTVTKHSLNIDQRRTAVSLEPEFWEAFRITAIELGITQGQLAKKIRGNGTYTNNLSSAIRVYLFKRFTGSTMMSS